MSMPDTCLTPAAPSPIPIPYPNIAMWNQADGGTCSDVVKIKNKKTCSKKSKTSRTSGDEAGTNKGVASGSNMDECSRTKGYSEIKIEGDPVVTVFQPTQHNKTNAPPGCQMSPSQTDVLYTMV